MKEIVNKCKKKKQNKKNKKIHCKNKVYFNGEKNQKF